MSKPGERTTDRIRENPPGLTGHHRSVEERDRAEQPGRRGDEPATARSPLRLRLLLAGLAVPVFTVFLILALWGLQDGEEPREGLIAVAVICGLTVLSALIDTGVLIRRMRHRQRGGSGGLRD